MERRDFINSTLFSALGAMTATKVAAQTQQKVDPQGGNRFGLTTKLNTSEVRLAYLPGAKLGGSPLPYAYLYYDEEKKIFVSPLDLVPTMDAAKTYVLSPTLHVFNIKKVDQDSFKNLKNQVQLGFNCTAPNSSGDLTWIFMNAIDIFAGKDSANPKQLTKFLSSTGTGASLSSQPKVTITKGTLHLQVTAFGQKNDGFWKTFIDFVTGIVGTNGSTIANAFKGFGIPGLAADALQFVDHSLDVLANNERLVKLWDTGSLEFGIDPSKKSRFKMRQGLWITVDYDYARNSHYLEGHSLELVLGSFQLLDKQSRPVDANYLVADFDFAEQ